MKALTVSHLKDAAVSVVPESINIRNALLEKSIVLIDITNEEQKAVAVQIVRELKTMNNAVESNRQELKRPILDIGREIDGLASSFCVKTTSEVRRLENGISAFEGEQRRMREEEARKQREEEARARAEHERIERERIEAEAAAAKATEAERKAAEDSLFGMLEPDAPPTEGAELKTPPTETSGAPGPSAAELKAKADELRKQEAEAEAKRIEGLARVPVRQEKTAGLSVSAPWRFEVEDLAALYRARPDLCKIEARTADINKAIRKGARQIAGLRIYQDTKATVRT